MMKCQSMNLVLCYNFVMMKTQIEKKLFENLEKQDNIRAIWLGGAIATQTEDQYSDTDLMLIAPDANEAFRQIEDILNSFFTIEDIYHVEDPLPFKQKFYTIKNSAPTYYLDIAIFENSSPTFLAEQFFEKRHGKAIIISDKDNLINEAKKIAYEFKFKNVDSNLLSRFEIFYRTFSREALRNKFIDAYTFYLRLVQIYILIARINYKPFKYDFGMRYLYLDLPKEKVFAVEEFLKITSIEDMQKNASLMNNEIKKLKLP